MSIHLIRRFLIALSLVAFFGCAGTAYVVVDPPAAKEEVQPARPGPRAVWIPGHWKWHKGQYVWEGGHWAKKAKGAWVAGHWDKRPRGWVWVPGHWRK
ncbi:MAG TPA: hypothetical protein VGB22_04530 [candidate division Zixibacteria bacterium]|jgi:hypothetical protein